MSRKYDDRVAKAKFVHKQLKSKSPFMTAYDNYIESSDIRFFNIEEVDEEIITLTEEVFDEKNTNRSRSVK